MVDYIVERKTGGSGELPNRLFLYPETGAEKRIRTADLLITNQLLYQLSYLGLFRINYLRFPEVAISPFTDDN